MQNNNDQLGELKSLLFDEEFDTFKRLEKQISELNFSLDSHEQIMARVSPLFDDILIDKLQDKESQTVKIYAEHLATIIKKSAEQNLPQLSQSLQSVISPAISKEIEDNQDKMIDALYPIMGGMISKYVINAIEEMIESINKKIEDGLSLNKYKRKVKSKVSGVSETELLLNESRYAEIHALFIIQKESGLLIAEEHLENQEIDDPHMVASMASAIKDFVNDWVSTNPKISEIQLLSYGNATLYIESAGSVYLIAFLNVEPSYEERNEIQKFFVQIIRKYTPFFHTFDGDDSASEIVTIKQQMQAFLNKENINDIQEEKKKSNFVKYFFLFLFIPLFLYLGYWAKETYDKYSLEKYIFTQTGEHIEIDKIDDTLYVAGHVKTIEEYNEVEQVLNRKGYKDIVNEVYLPLNTINQKVADQKIELDTVQESVLTLQKEMKTLSSKYKNTVLQLRQMQVLKNIDIDRYKRIHNTFKDIKQYNSQDSSLTFNDNKLFKTGGVIPQENSLKNLGLVFTKYIEVLTEDNRTKHYLKEIMIENHTDSAGTFNINQSLSYQRANQIRNYLLSLKIVKRFNLEKLLKIKGLGQQHLIYVDGKEDMKASRRIIIKFKYYDENIKTIIK
jgi:flagellar motor protein MotB